MKKILCLGGIQDKHIVAMQNVGVEPIVVDENMDLASVIRKYPNAPVMKCDIHSDDFLRKIISANRDLTDGARVWLTHCAVFFDTTGHRHPFILTDGACIPYPTAEQMVHIIENAVLLYDKVFESHRVPNISLISAGGDSNKKISPMLHEFVQDSNMQLRIEQLDVALDISIRREKHISGDIADIIVVPDINTGNAIWKSLTVLGTGWICAGVLMGTAFPVILNSRGTTAVALTKNIEILVK